MWQAERKRLNNGNTELLTISEASKPLSYGRALKLLISEARFRTFLSDAIRQTPFDAFRWETPAITTDSSAQAFQFVLHNAPYLHVRSDYSAFNEHFQNTSATEVISFCNLAGDATLVVPCPDSKQTDFAHFGAFLRNASDQQTNRLWLEIGKAGLAKISKKPLWINTAGDGVAWLHVRLDTRPKYYQHLPYKTYQ